MSQSSGTVRRTICVYPELLRLVVAALLLMNVALYQIRQLRTAADILDKYSTSTSTTSRTEQTNSSRAAAIALPAIPQDKDFKGGRKAPVYGGQSERKHVGGFIKIDWNSISPAVWKFMVGYIGVKSILDVGCGKGFSTAWFALHGVEAQCVEGSREGIVNTLLPDPQTQLVEHDFSRGPWWPAKTVDAIWCMEVTEHIGRNYQHHYLESFKRAAFIFVSHAVGGGGWHHVEVHDGVWWRARWESFGLLYSDDLSRKVVAIAKAEADQNISRPDDAKAFISASYITEGNLQVFINPAVASLPEHAHLMAEHGCVDGNLAHGRHGRHICGTKEFKESALPERFLPLSLTAEMDVNWETVVLAHLTKDHVTP